VAVALVRDMYLQSGRTAAEQTEFFAKFLHRSWGVGDVSCNNGLVFFLSVGSRQVHVTLMESASLHWTGNVFALAAAAAP